MTEALERVGQRAPGSGRLDLYGFATPTQLGVAVDYEHRVRQRLALFARGHVGAVRDSGPWRKDAAALAGLRYTF